MSSSSFSGNAFNSQNRKSHAGSVRMLRDTRQVRSDLVDSYGCTLNHRANTGFSCPDIANLRLAVYGRWNSLSTEIVRDPFAGGGDALP
eukprot:11903273-Prorocentrum_lima.AAC.1